MTLLYLSLSLSLLCSQTFVAGTDANGLQFSGKQFAVIVAGAKSYNDYFSQADACHVYQSLRNGGMPAENIIHLNFDDVAHSPDNPFPGTLVNTVGGADVHKGCQIDYSGDSLTPELFLHVITGNKTGVRMLTGREGKVLESGQDDHVFMAFSSHGNTGIFGFPNDVLHAHDLVNALKQMHASRMYAKLVIQMCSCQSGSMFDGLLPEDINIYATTCTKPDQLGWQCCYDHSRGAFLGTFFMNSLTYTTDNVDNRKDETIGGLFKAEVAGCELQKSISSEPQEYGNKSISNLSIAEFMGHVQLQMMRTVLRPQSVRKMSHDGMVSVFTDSEEDLDMPPFLRNPPLDMVALATLMRRLRSKDMPEEEREALTKRLDYLLQVKDFAESLTLDIVRKVTQDRLDLVPKRVASEFQPVKNHDCYKTVLKDLRFHCPLMQVSQFPFIGRSFQAFVNMCNSFDTRIVIKAIEGATSGRAKCQLTSVF